MGNPAEEGRMGDATGRRRRSSLPSWRKRRVHHRKVLERREYSSIREALEEVGVEGAIPQARSVDEALREYRRFYSEEKERKYGVVAFRVRTVAEYPGEIHKELLLKYLPHLKEVCAK